jgi:membrane-bound lytic murein transglycosylase A
VPEGLESDIIRPMRRSSRAALVVAVLGLGLSGCALWPFRRAAPPIPPAVRHVSPSEIPRFADELPRDSLLAAMQRSLRSLEKNPPSGTFRFAETDYTSAAVADSLRHFAQILADNPDERTLDARIRADFDVFQSTGMDPRGKVIFSAYYEPAFPASKKKEPGYPYPLYRRPSDLIDVQMSQFNPKWRGEHIAGRVSGTKLLPYFSREDIDADQALAGRDLEIAWLADAFDRLDLHIEGSGILEFTDGTRLRARFDGTNELPYRSVGRILLDSGALSKNQATHEGVREYFRTHPDARSWVIARDERYTFFRLDTVEPDSGPMGTLQQPLEAGRSIAVDDRIFPLGALAFITLPIPVTDSQGKLLALAPTSRFVLAQDTGGAIQGPGRVDLFVGSGDAAKAVATRLWNEGRLYFLLRKLPPPRR